MSTAHLPTVTVYFFAHAAGHDQSRPQHYDVRGDFATADERDAFLASVPKSLGLKPSTLSTYDAAGSRVTVPTIRGGGRLLADGVNGGVNEAGLKRLRRLLADERFGYRGDTAANAYRTAEAALAAL